MTDFSLPLPNSRKKDKRVVRAAGGELWEDKTMLEWDDSETSFFSCSFFFLLFLS